MSSCSISFSIMSVRKTEFIYTGNCNSPSAALPLYSTNLRIIDVSSSDILCFLFEYYHFVLSAFRGHLILCNLLQV